MNRILFVQCFFLLVIRYHSSHAQSCPCTPSGTTLTCYVTGNNNILSTSSCSTTGIGLINIVYNGVTVLDLIAPSTIPISIGYNATSSANTLQIRSIRTNSTRIDVRIFLATNQNNQLLFISTLWIDAPSSTFSIRVVQNVTNPSSFRIFDTSGLRNVNISKYEVIFDTTGTAGGVRRISIKISPFLC